MMFEYDSRTLRPSRPGPGQGPAWQADTWGSMGSNRPPSPQLIAALQRGAGNAAVQRWLGDGRAPASVQRCGDHAAPGCPCHGEDGGGGAAAHALPVQRAKIPYGTLTWGDFKGAPPKASEFAAETHSDFSPADKAKKKVSAPTKTGQSCPFDKSGRKMGAEFRVKITVDPATFDTVKSFFWQEKSWVKPDVKAAGKAATADEVKKCKEHFDAQSKSIAEEADKQCVKLTGDCRQAFADGKTWWQVDFDGKPIKVTSAEDCTKTFPKACKAASIAAQKPGEISWAPAVDTTKCPEATAPAGGATATKRDECDTKFKAAVDAYGKSESARVLSHEQLHFKVTDKATQDLKADLISAVEPMAVDTTGCGEAKAKENANKAFAALKVDDKVDAKQKAAKAAISADQSTYDTETCHGVVASEQEKWKEKYFPPPPSPTQTTF